jgi:hypothetical protein
VTVAMMACGRTRERERAFAAGVLAMSGARSVQRGGDGAERV